MDIPDLLQDSPGSSRNGRYFDQKVSKECEHTLIRRSANCPDEMASVLQSSEWLTTVLSILLSGFCRLRAIISNRSESHEGRISQRSDFSFSDRPEYGV
eukprot:scaffold1289_cov178-Amphora_coffeaeformis.AAC.2